MENDPSDEKLDRLFAAARRAEPYSTDLEYGFESRVMGKIRAKREGETPFLMWVWRLIPVFASLIVLIGIWIYAAEPGYAIDLSAISGPRNEETTIIAFLAGE